MSTYTKLRKKAKKAVGGVTRQVGRSVTKTGQQVGHAAAKAAPVVLGTAGYVVGGPVGAGIGAGIGTTLDRKYNHDDSWKESLGTGAKAGIGTGGAIYGGEQLLNYLAPEIMGQLGYGTTVAPGATGATGGNTVLGANGMSIGTVPKTVGAVPGGAPGLLGDLGGYGKYITPSNLMLGGMGYGLLKGGTGPQDDGGTPAPGTFSPQLPQWYGGGQGMPTSQGVQGQGMAPGYMESQGMMNQLMARMQNPQMMQNPMQNPMFTR